MVNVTHHTDNRRALDLLFAFIRAGNFTQHFFFEGILAHRLGLVAQLFGHQDRRFLIQRLVDGCHHTHTHQGLDHISGFDGHTLGEITNGNGFRNLYFSYHGLCGPLESMTLFFRFLFGPQRLAKSGFLFVFAQYHRLFYRTAARTTMASLFLLRLAFFNIIAALTHLLFFLLGLAIPTFILRRRHGNVLRRDGRLCGFCSRFRSSFGFGFCCGRSFRFRGFGRCSFRCHLRRFFHRRLFGRRCLYRLFRCRRLSFRLGLKLCTLDIGAALAHFYVDSLGLASLKRRRGLALECNLPRFGFRLTMGFSQIGQQLLLLIAGDSVAFAPGFQARFHDLLQQTIHGSAYICGQLFYRYFSHTGPPLPNQAWSSNQGARAVIIS